MTDALAALRRRASAVGLQDTSAGLVFYVIFFSFPVEQHDPVHAKERMCPVDVLLPGLGCVAASCLHSRSELHLHQQMKYFDLNFFVWQLCRRPMTRLSSLLICLVYGTTFAFCAPFSLCQNAIGTVKLWPSCLLPYLDWPLNKWNKLDQLNPATLSNHEVTAACRTSWQLSSGRLVRPCFFFWHSCGDSVDQPHDCMFGLEVFDIIIIFFFQFEWKKQPNILFSLLVESQRLYLCICNYIICNFICMCNKLSITASHADVLDAS